MANLHKRKKTNEGGKDMLSKLNEPILSHILSFLPIKDAVRTSVLSKKWVHRWTLINKVAIDDRLFYSRKKKKTGTGKQCFINFLNRVLLLTQSYGLDSFSLVITNKYDLSLVNTWIANIFSKRIKNVYIDSDIELRFSILTCRFLFASYSLQELVLKMRCCVIRVTIEHAYICFSYLKLLKLSGITFTMDSPLTLTLPVLKRFETVNCNWLNGKNPVVTFDAPLLECVYVEQDRKLESHEPRSCAIKFVASHLTEFSYCGYGISQTIILSGPSSARNASASIILKQCVRDKVPDTGSHAFMLLQQFSQVRQLKFDGSEVLPKQKLADLTVFKMLNHLELGLVTGEVLLGLLLKTPVLNTLHLKGICKFDQELLNSAAVPKCLESTLEVVRLERVNGSENELNLAKFVMENGQVVKRMSFSTASYLRGTSKAMEEFKEKLFSFKKGTSFTILEFLCNYY